MSTYNQGNPSVSQLISAANCIVYGNTSSGNALSVQQLGAGNVFVTSNASGRVGLFVSATSNVGIGTTNPGNLLHVYGGNIQLGSTGTALVTNYVTGSDFGNLSLQSGYQGASSAPKITLVGYTGAGTVNGDNIIQLATNGSTRMTVNQSGNVGIGTASPSYPLHVQTSAASASVAAKYFNVSNNPTNTTGAWTVSIYGVADVATSGNIVAFSDKRAKVPEAPPSESYLNLVDKIQVRQFSWINKIEKDPRKKIGFFAQEVEEVVPDAVGTTTDVVPTIYREADAFTETTVTVKGHGLTTEKKLEVVDPENGKTKIDIVRVIDADNLEVKFEKVPKEKLFVVGPEVDDSRMVNHDYLMAVGFGGLKELHALVKTQQTTIEMLTERLEALEQSLATANISSSEARA